jgi:hypothetical protein
LNRASPRRWGVRRDDGRPIEAGKTSQASGDRVFREAVGRGSDRSIINRGWSMQRLRSNQRATISAAAETLVRRSSSEPPDQRHSRASAAGPTPDRQTSVVRLIQQAIQLRGRRPQPAHNLALRERALCDSFLCFERQSVQQEIAEVRRILVVLEDLLDVYRAGAAGAEHVGTGLMFVFRESPAGDARGRGRGGSMRCARNWTPAALRSRTAAGATGC